MNNRPKHPNVRRSLKEPSRQRDRVHVRNLVHRQEQDMNKILYPLVIMVLIIIILIYIQNVIIQWNVMEDNYQTNIQMVTDMSLNMSDNMGIVTKLFDDAATQEAYDVLNSVKDYYRDNTNTFSTTDINDFVDRVQDRWLDINILDPNMNDTITMEKEILSDDTFKFFDIDGAFELSSALRTNAALEGTWITISTQTDVVLKYLFLTTSDGKYTIEIYLNLANYSNNVNIYDFESYANDLVDNFDNVKSAYVFNSNGKSTSNYVNGEAQWITQDLQPIFQEVLETKKETIVNDVTMLGYKDTIWAIPIRISIGNEENVFENYVFILSFSNHDAMNYFYIQAIINMLIALISIFIIVMIIVRNTKQYMQPLGLLTRSIDIAATGDYNEPAQIKGAAIMRTTIEKYNDLLLKIKEAIRMRNDAYFQTIEALVSSLDASDPYTAGHCQRVMQYSLMLAEKIGLSKEQNETLKLGSLLHDIGKIGIDTQIVNKKGRLTDEEFMQIRQHPSIGLKIMGKVDYLKNMQRVMVEHHEKWNGKGYPYGLKEDKIQLLARIVALADTYDAMSSNRSYRKALDKDIVIEELRRNAGIQFDPELVEPFIEAIQELGGNGRL